MAENSREEDLVPWLVATICAGVFFVFFRNWNSEHGWLLAHKISNFLSGRAPATGLNFDLFSVIVAGPGVAMRDISLTQHIFEVIAIGWAAWAMARLILLSGGNLIAATLGGVWLASYMATNETWGLGSNLWIAACLATVLAIQSGRNVWLVVAFLVLLHIEGLVFAAMVLAVAVYRKEKLLPGAMWPLVASGILVTAAVFGLTNLSYAVDHSQSFFESYLGQIGRHPFGYKLIGAIAVLGVWKAVTGRHALVQWSICVVLLNGLYLLVGAPDSYARFVPADSALTIFAAYAFGIFNTKFQWLRGSMAIILCALLAVGGSVFACIRVPQGLHSAPSSFGGNIAPLKLRNTSPRL